MDNERTVNVPEEPTDEIIRAMLAVRLPATYREYLRHPLAGPETAKQTERDIAITIKEYKAILRVVKENQ